MPISKIENYFTNLLEKRKTILWAWLAMFLVGSLAGPQAFFISELKMLMPDDSPSGIATKGIIADFPNGGEKMQREIDDTLLVWCDNCTITDTDKAKEMSLKFRGKIATWNLTYPGLFPMMDSYFDHDEEEVHRMLSPEKRHFLVEFTVRYSDMNQEAKRAMRDLRDLVAGHFKTDYFTEDGLHAAMVGPFSQFLATEEAVYRSMFSTDLIAIPIMAVILWMMLGSWRRAAIPLLCAGVAVVASWTLLLVVVVLFQIHMNSFTLHTQAFLALAICLDYGLFLLTRFQEGRKQGQSLPSALWNMEYYSGKVVLISGSVLLFGWISLALYPSANELLLLAHGLGAAITIIVSVVAALSITPCLIAQFPVQFDDGVTVGGERPGSSSAASDPQAPPPAALSSPGQEMWKLWGRFLIKAPFVYVIPFCFFLIMLPVGHHALTADMNHDMMLTVARGTPEQEAFEQRLVKYFTISNINPTFFSFRSNELPALPVESLIPAEQMSTVQLREEKAAAEKPAAATKGSLVECQTKADGTVTGSACRFMSESESLLVGDDNPQPVKSIQFFDLGCSLAKDVIAAAAAHPSFKVNPEQIVSVFYNQNTKKCISYKQAARHLEKNEIYREVWGELVNPQNSSAVLSVRQNAEEPFGLAATQFVKLVRNQVLPRFDASPIQVRDKRYQLSVQMTSQLANVMDTEDALYSIFLPVLVGTVALMFLIVAYGMGAAWLPLRLLATNAIPIAFVYGVAVYIYQDGFLDQLKVDQVKSVGGLLFWLPPFTVTILVGLALDYEIFLFSRVWEYRQQGYDNDSAVVKALASTGPVITAAGVVMALAFCSALFSKVPSNSQFGFIMVVGVLVDTFLIRSVLVPCMLVWLPKANYWPTQMPEPSKHEMDDDRQKLLGVDYS